MTLSTSEAKEARAYSRWQSAVEMAEKLGLVIVLPRPYEAFVDIDCAADREWFDKAIAKLRETEPVDVTIRPSPSGEPDHFHAVVRFKLRELDAAERIAVQAALGSDRMREVLGIARHFGEEPSPTLFFEKPDVADDHAWEASAYEKGLEFANAEFEYDAEHHAQSVERKEPRREHRIWWVRFSHGGGGCYEGTKAEVEAFLQNTVEFAVRSIEPMPYPRDPRMGPHKIEGLPALCYGRPGECAGHTACPMRGACSE